MMSERVVAADIERVVRAQLVDAQAHILGWRNKRLSRARFAWELTACVLGSRVRAESVHRALHNLKANGLLTNECWSSKRENRYENRVYSVISGQARVLKYRQGIRFARVRASQLARARAVVASGELSEHLALADATLLRRALVHKVPGIGPKQASLLMRNLKFSTNTAVLDAHFLRYLSLCHGVHEAPASVARLATYERVERFAEEIAHGYGVNIAVFDLAVWSTMAAINARVA